MTPQHEKFAHFYERLTSGQRVECAVFDARATSGLDSDNADVLANLTNKAQATGYKIDLSALAYNDNGRLMFYGAKELIDFLSKSGPPQ